MCRSIITLSKIAHQMWCDHPFSQRTKTTERRGGGWRQQGRGDEENFQKGSGGRQYRGRGLHKVGGFRNLLPTIWQ